MNYFCRCIEISSDFSPGFGTKSGVYASIGIRSRNDSKKKQVANTEARPLLSSESALSSSQMPLSGAFTLSDELRFFPTVSMRLANHFARLRLPSRYWCLFWYLGSNGRSSTGCSVDRGFFPGTKETTLRPPCVNKISLNWPF
jgi:hypothetical protein